MKIWLTFMTGIDDLENVEELVSPVIEYFDGIVSTVHDDFGKAAYDYIYRGDPDREGEELKSVMSYMTDNKKEGQFVVIPYMRRHDFSRNAYLHCGAMKNGDFFVQIDVLERLGVDFAKNMRNLVKEMKENNINMLYYHGKPFLVEYHESLSYFGSPHEGLQRLDGKLAALDFTPMQPDEGKVRLNVRPLKRPDPFHWVNHYVKYMLFPFGSNHVLLGLEQRYNKPQMSDAYKEREINRLAFIEELEKRGFERSVGGVIKMLSGNLDEKLKRFLNTEKVWQDAYRYNVLCDKTVVDEHKWDSMIKIE